MRKRRKARKAHGGRRYIGAFDGTKSTLDELDALLNNPDHHMLVKHYKKSCSHCKNLDPEWKSVVNRLSDVNPEFTVANLNPDATAHMNEHHYKNHDYDVNGFPTIVYINKIKNVKPKEYNGDRTAHAILEWLVKVINDKRIKITIESGDNGSKELHENNDDMPLDQDQAEDAFPPAPPNSFDQDPVEDAFSPPPPAMQAEDAPESEPSAVTKVTGTIKDTASAIDDKIGQGVGAIKSALTNDLDFGNMFSSSESESAPPAPAPAPPAPAPAPAPPAPAPPLNPTLDPTPPLNPPLGPLNPPLEPNPDFIPAPIKPVPAVPSLVGGIKKNRRHTRRKNKSKSKCKSKSKRKSA